MFSFLTSRRLQEPHMCYRILGFVLVSVIFILETRGVHGTHSATFSHCTDQWLFQLVFTSITQESCQICYQGPSFWRIWFRGLVCSQGICILITPQKNLIQVVHDFQGHSQTQVLRRATFSSWKKRNLGKSYRKSHFYLFLFQHPEGSVI